MAHLRPHACRRKEDELSANLFLSVAWTALFLMHADALTFPADRQALIDLKSRIDPTTISFSSCLGSWDFVYDPCEPQSSVVFVCGFACEPGLQGQMRVTRLTLDYGAYGGALSPAIGNLSALQELDVSGNFFEGSIPDSVGQLSQLRRLDVSNNGLTGVIPASFAMLGSLQFMSLAKNKLGGRLPYFFNQLTQLTELYINKNSFTGPFPILRDLTRLQYLDASANRFSGHLPYGLPSGLILLSLRNNQIAGLLPRNLDLLTHLAVLDLAGNNLRGRIPFSPFQLPSLQQLNLSHNSFTSISVPNMQGVGSVLVAVDLSFNFIAGNLPPNFAYMQHLHALSLRQNRFTGAIPQLYAEKVAGRIPGVDKLDRLFLDKNFLTGEIPSPLLSPMPDLTASLVDNCLDSCPSYLDFCRGGDQRSPSACGKPL